MEVSRRVFLGGAIAASCAVALPGALTAMPTIYGDGIHDDWEGMDALCNGRPVRMLTDTISVRPNGLIEMISGDFRLSKTLRIKCGGPLIWVGDSRLTWTEPVDCCLYFEDTNPKLENWSDTRLYYPK